MILIWWFSILYSIVIAQRLWELRLAGRNARHIRAKGGYEVGAEHYKYLVLLHTVFLGSLLVEFALRSPDFSAKMFGPLAVFLLLQAARVWCIRSLGVHWNTRILVLPGMELVRKGPYRYLRHPNYTIVTLELLLLPLAFGCYLCAALFPVINLWVLNKRISMEEQALFAVSVSGSNSGAMKQDP